MENISMELEKVKTSGANLLMPSTDIGGLSEWHAPIIEKVLLSSKPEDGDIYEHDRSEDGPDKKYRLTGQALNKISMCAGVVWPPEQNFIVKLEKNYVSYQAVGGIRKSDGSYFFVKALYDLDLEVIEIELTEQYEQKAKKLKKDIWSNGKKTGTREATEEEKAEYISYCVKRDLIQKRKHKVPICETGARDRVIRKILGLKNVYTKSEINMPFVAARIVFRPDYNDPEVKTRLIEASIQSMTGIFGSRKMTEAIREAKPINIIPVEDGAHDLDRENFTTDLDEAAGVDQQTGEVLEASSATAPALVPLEEFRALSDVSKIQELCKGAALKEYDLDGFLRRANKKKVSDLTQEKLEEMYSHILSLPMPEGLPF